MKYTFFMRSMLLFLMLPIRIILAQNSTTIHLIPEMADGAPASKFYKSVTFIPLETNKASVFNRIERLEVDNEYLYILDQSSSSIFKFTRMGTFVKKIQDIKTFGKIHSFKLSPNNELIIQGSISTDLLVCNTEGEVLRRVSTAQIPEKDPNRKFILRSYDQFPNGNFLVHFNRPYTTHKTFETPGYDLYLTDQNGHITNSLFAYNPYTQQDDYANVQQFSSGNRQSDFRFYYRPYEYDIHQISDTGLFHTYRFLFPAAMSLPSDFHTDEKYLFKRTIFAEDPAHINIIKGFQQVNILGDYLLLTLNHSRPKKDKIIAYNLKTKRHLSFGRVTPDESTYFLPTLDPMLGAYIVGYSETSMYVSISALMLNQWYNANKNSKIAYPEVLKSVLEENNPLQNPFVIEIRLL
jgi:hypothetical protein